MKGVTKTQLRFRNWGEPRSTEHLCFSSVWCSDQDCGFEIMTEFTLRLETSLCFNCFYCVQISHEWRRRLPLVVILFILWGVLLSCYNKHSNVTVDRAAGGSSHHFSADLHSSPEEPCWSVSVWMRWCASGCSTPLCHKMALCIWILCSLLVYFWLQLPCIEHFNSFFMLSCFFYIWLPYLFIFHLVQISHPPEKAPTKGRRCLALSR